MDGLEPRLMKRLDDRLIDGRKEIMDQRDEVFKRLRREPFENLYEAYFKTEQQWGRYPSAEQLRNFLEPMGWEVDDFLKAVKDKWMK